MDTTFGSDVRLECDVSDPMANCEWYKDGIPLDGDSAGIDGHKRYLQFPSILHDIEGEYACRCGNESTKARLKVKGLSFYSTSFNDKERYIR